LLSCLQEFLYQSAEAQHSAIIALTSSLSLPCAESENYQNDLSYCFWAWGHNLWGQLGDATYYSRFAPVRVQGITDVASIAAGQSHSLAVRRDGTLWTWGSNWNGRLGDGTNTGRLAPVQIQGLTDVVYVTAGWSHSFEEPYGHGD